MVTVRRTRLFGLGVALALSLGLLATSVTPGSAANPPREKIFSFSVTPNQAPAGQPTSFAVKATNKTPGNSTINSVSVTVPAAPSNVSLSNQSSNENKSATVTLVGSTIKVENLDPLKTNQFVQLNVTATLTDPCSTWTADARTGSSGNGDPFDPTPPYPVITTTTDVATTLAITSVFDEQYGSPLLSTGGHFVARPAPDEFTVEVQAQDAAGDPAPVCEDTTVALSEDGKGSLSGTTQRVLAAGQSDLTFGGLTYSVAEDGVTLTAMDTDPGILAAGMAIVDFNGSLALAEGTPGTQGQIATFGSAGCTPTASTPFCVTVTLPNGWSGTAALFLEDCGGACTFGLLSALIADLKDEGEALYDNSEPFDFFTIEIGCDRTVCRGGNLKDYQIFIDPDDLEGPLGYIESPPCTESIKDFIDPYDPASGQTFCTDYVSAHRDNNQDTFLLVRAAGIDARKRM